MATRNIVPRADGEGKLGTTAKKWGEVHAGSVATGSVTATGAVSAGSVTTTGAVSAGSVAATGAVTANSVTSAGAVSATGITTRQNSTAYAVDDVAFTASIPGKLVLVCTTAGTTAASEPDMSGAAAGGTVTDGTVVWTYKNIVSNYASRGLDNLTQAGEDHYLEQDFTIIYPNNGTAANPANVAVNSRYVESNPFPGYVVKAEVEVYYNNKWGNPGWYSFYSDVHRAAGARCNQLDNGDIVIQTGLHPSYLMYLSALSGNPFGISSESGLSSAYPCRVKVWKIGKVANS